MSISELVRLMGKDFLRNDKKARDELRETLDYLNDGKNGNDDSFLKKEIRKLRKLGGGVL